MPSCSVAISTKWRRCASPCRPVLPCHPSATGPRTSLALWRAACGWLRAATTTTAAFSCRLTARRWRGLHARFAARGSRRWPSPPSSPLSMPHTSARPPRSWDASCRKLRSPAQPTSAVSACSSAKMPDFSTLPWPALRARRFAPSSAPSAAPASTPLYSSPKMTGRSPAQRRP
jgi:hypothetical protein